MNLNSKDFSEKLASNQDSGWPDLDPKHKMFLANYAISYNVKEAAQETPGVSPSAGSKLLRDPLALAFLNQIQDVLAQRSIITRDFVNAQWLRLLPKVMGDEEVPLIDKDGPLMAKKFDGGAAAKVLTELSKSTNFYADGSGQSASVNISIDLGALGIKEDKGVTIEGNK